MASPAPGRTRVYPDASKEINYARAPAVGKQARLARSRQELRRLPTDAERWRYDLDLIPRATR